MTPTLEQMMAIQEAIRSDWGDTPTLCTPTMCLVEAAWHAVLYEAASALEKHETTHEELRHVDYLIAADLVRRLAKR